MPLTTSELERLKPRDKDYAISDSKGLRAIVTNKGSIYWRFNYRFEGKQKTLAVGVYPKVSLSEARKVRDEQGLNFLKVSTPLKSNAKDWANLSDKKISLKMNCFLLWLNSGG